MISITHNNSVYSEDITELANIAVPQKVHQVTDGGLFVKKGIKTLPSVLVEKLLDNGEGTVEFLANTLSSEGRNGFILATGGSVWTGYGANIKQSKDYPTLKLLPLGMSQIYAGQIANRLGEFEYISTDTTSCVSGHAALNQARLLIQAGELDRVVILSTDNATSEEFLKFFREQALTLSLTEETKHIDKFRLGQAANIVVLENESAMQASGNTAIGLLHGAALVSEINSNPLGIRTDGAGYILAIEKALEQADLLPEDIDVVKKHATMSTDNNVENMVVRTYFEDARIVNYKQRIGHTMGVSTAVEMHIAMKEESGMIISLGAGMGNVFTAAIVEVVNGN